MVIIMKKVSIIVPIFNCQNYLNKGIDSLINQTYKSLEIVLVDDGSTDGSEKICDEYSQKDKRIKVLHQKNQGVSSARNNGLKSASGEYIFFMDSDDYLDANAIKELVAISSDNSLARLSIMRHFKNNSIKQEEKNNESTIAFINNIAESKEDGYCWGFLFERNKILSGFDSNTSYMEDTLFLIRYLSQIENVVSTTESFYHYIDNSNGISSPKGNITLKIKDALYSLSEINKEGKKLEIPNIDIKINIKKILITEYLMQNANKEQITEIVKNKEIKNIVNLKNNELSFRFKIFIHLLKKEKINLLLFYYKIRKILKKMKRGI